MCGSADLLYFAGPDAARANMHADMGAMVADGLHPLQVRFRYLFVLFVGMTHLVALERAFTADLTGPCHDDNPPKHKNNCLKSRRMLP